MTCRTRAAIVMLMTCVLVRTGLRSDTLSAPIISVWYRGAPVGTPRRVDLVQIRAAGFSAITWPAERAEAAGALQRLAADEQLVVFSRTVGPSPAAAAA